MRTYVLARAAAVAAVLAVTALFPHAPHAQDQAAPSVDDTYVLTGFRSADFGMSEEQVRSAIEADFGVSGEDVVELAQDVQKTRALAVFTDDILPDTGRARIVYLFGYTSGGLIQVTVTMGAPVDEEMELRDLLAAGNQLRNHFLTQGYQSDTVIANQPINDAQIVFFRGFDVGGRMTLLTLTAPPAPEGDEGATPPPPSLSLAYILAPEEPDVFEVQPGQF